MKYEIIVNVNQENENEAENARKILISSRTFEEVKGLLILADILEDGKQLPDPAENEAQAPTKRRAGRSEENLERMIKTFDKAHEFTQKKGGLDLSSNIFVALAAIEDTIDALLYAYSYGFRRGYNKAAKAAEPKG